MSVPLLPLFGSPFLLDRRRPTVETRHFDPDFTRIRCPKCDWRPQKDDRWLCLPGCHNRWNTFDTAGICPSCHKHWEDTACLRCGGWSPHAAWYVDGKE